MYLLRALVLAAIGLYCYPGDISDIPFAALTLSKAGNYIIAWGFWAYAGYSVMISLSKDRIWPWRWKTWEYAAGLLVRLVMCSGYLGLFYYYLQGGRLVGWLLIVAIVVLACMLLWAMFTEEFDFERKKNTGAGADPGRT